MCIEPLGGICLQIEEPQYTRRRVQKFLSEHTCYELIPESGKVVLIDEDLPVRQAFHALHEQGVASAPLWDSEQVAVTGMISASDFIHVLQRLRSRWVAQPSPSACHAQNLSTLPSKQPMSIISLHYQDLCK